MATLKIKKRDESARQHPQSEAVRAVVASEELVRVNFQVAEPLRRRLKARAAQEGRTVQEIVTGLIEEYLSK